MHYLLHCCMNRKGEFRAKFILYRLNAQHFHLTPKLRANVTRQYGKWKGMGGCAHAINRFKRNPSNGTRWFIQMGSINKQNEFRLKGAQLARMIFRSGASLYDEEVGYAEEVFISQQFTCHDQARGVISTQIITDSNQANPWKTVRIMPFGLQLLGQ